MSFLLLFIVDVAATHLVLLQHDRRENCCLRETVISLEISGSSCFGGGSGLTRGTFIGGCCRYYEFSLFISLAEIYLLEILKHRFQAL